MCSSSPEKVLRWICTPKGIYDRLSCTTGCRQCGHNVVKFKVLGNLIRCSCRTRSISSARRQNIPSGPQKALDEGGLKTPLDALATATPVTELSHKFQLQP